MDRMTVGISGLGRWTEDQVFHVTAERIGAFADAINDDEPRHLQGVAVPPLFACVPITSSTLISGSLDGVIGDDDRRLGLHAEQDILFHAPIAPGMTLYTRAAPIGVRPMTSGTAVVVKAESRSEDRLVSEFYITLVIRRKSDGPASGEQSPDHRTPPEAKAAARSAGTIVSAVQTIDLDQTRRYAAASGDWNPIHLDPEFARSVGLQGIIVHGMCTMGFVSRVVIATACAGDPTRLARLAVRFARPIYPGQTITTNLWTAGTASGRAVYGFETLNPGGKAVIQDGLAEVR